MWGKSISQSIEEHAISLSKIYYYLLSHSKRSGITKVLIEASSMTPEATKQLKEGWGLKYEPDEKELIDIHNREISELIEQYCK